MAFNNPLEILSFAERQAIIESYGLKVKDAEEEEENLLQELAQIRENIKRWRQFLESVSEVTPGVIPTTVHSPASVAKSLGYDPEWTRVEKIKFAVLNPELIGKKSLAGAADVVALLLQLDPSILEGNSQEVFVRLVSAQLSNMAWKGRGQLMKLREKNNITTIHYFDPSWFEEDGVLKQEHEHLLNDLEYIPVKPGESQSETSSLFDSDKPIILPHSEK